MADGQREGMTFISSSGLEALGFRKVDKMTWMLGFHHISYDGTDFKLKDIRILDSQPKKVDYLEEITNELQK